MDSKPECRTCTNDHCFVKRNYEPIKEDDFYSRKLTLRCRKSQQFILEGSPVQGLFFVYKGAAKVTKTGLNGKDQIVRFATDGEVIGHRGFGVGQVYPISATALDDTILCNFSTEVFTKMLMTIPTLTLDLMRFYAEELNRSEAKVKKFAQMSVREKVIDAFVLLNRVFGHGDYLNIVLSRREIADLAGTTEEQVIRTISALKKDKLIKAEGKKLGILDLEALKREIADFKYYSI